MRSKAYNAGQIMNVWLLGCLCGVTLYACIRNAAVNEAEFSRRYLPPRTVRTNTLDAVACFAPVVRNQEMNGR
jgi:hypothetical protein